MSEKRFSTNEKGRGPVGAHSTTMHNGMSQPKHTESDATDASKRRHTDNTRWDGRSGGTEWEMRDGISVCVCGLIGELCDWGFSIDPKEQAEVPKNESDGRITPHYQRGREKEVVSDITRSNVSAILPDTSMMGDQPD